MKIFKRLSPLALVIFLSIFGLSSVSVTAKELKDLPDEKIGSAYKKVDLDSYIKTQRPHKKGGKSILPIKRVMFNATLMSKPKQGKFNYIYMALDMMHMKPMPVIKHQVFVGAKDGEVISVYLEEHFAKVLEKHIKLGNIKIGEDLVFKGYHSYNYKRGPAMVMEGLFDDQKDKVVLK